VEEIASLILIVARHADDETVLAAEGASMAIISRTLKAVVDGMPLPGEVGRMPLKKLLKSPYDPDKVIWGWMSDLSLLIDTDILIALSPTGTGEEEK